VRWITAAGPRWCWERRARHDSAVDYAEARTPPTSYTTIRAWPPEAMAAADADLVRRGLVAAGRSTTEGRRLRETIEEQTEAALTAPLGALGPGPPDLTRQLDQWSAAIGAAGYAPPDPYKRISG
jgi:hypothetical protein